MARAWVNAELFSTFSLACIWPTFWFIAATSWSARSACWSEVRLARLAAASAAAIRLTVPFCSCASCWMIDARLRTCCESGLCSNSMDGFSPPVM